MLNYYPRVQNFTLRWLVFQIIGVLYLSVGYNGEFVILEKIFKNLNLKISKIPNVVL